MAERLDLKWRPADPAAAAFSDNKKPARALLGDIVDGRGICAARALFAMAVAAPQGGRWLAVAPSREHLAAETVRAFLAGLPGGGGYDDAGEFHPRFGRWDGKARRYELKARILGRDKDIVVRFLSAQSMEDRRRLDDAAQGVWLDGADQLGEDVFEAARRGNRTVLLTAPMPWATHWLAVREEVARFMPPGAAFRQGSDGESIAQKRARYRGYLDAAFGDDGSEVYGEIDNGSAQAAAEFELRASEDAGVSDAR